MAFTTWAALKTSILNDLADGSVLTKHYGTPTGHTRTFQDLSAVKEFLIFCDQQALAESGTRVNYVEFERPT